MKIHRLQNDGVLGGVGSIVVGSRTRRRLFGELFTEWRWAERAEALRGAGDSQTASTNSHSPSEIRTIYADARERGSILLEKNEIELGHRFECRRQRCYCRESIDGIGLPGDDRPPSRPPERRPLACSAALSSHSPCTKPNDYSRHV